jgi:adenylosuccinate lyase
VVAARLAAELPFMATEDLMLEAARRGGDRQQLHEVIRQASVEAARRMKEEGLENDLLDRLRKTPEFAALSFDELLEPSRFIGRAPEQVDRFVEEVVAPIRVRYEQRLAGGAALRV